MITTKLQIIAAGGTLVYNIVADTFRLLTTSDPVGVKFYRNGAEVGDASDMESGFASEGLQFDRVEIFSATTQAVKLAISDSGMRYDRQSGTVAISNMNGIFSHANPNVTNAAGGVVLSAANAARRYLAIQNNHATDMLRVTLDGTAPTATHGLKIPPGQPLELQGFVPVGAIKALSGIASNTDVEVVTA